ncbi:MAG TPA: exodeoxyribonuclease VII large subunit [Bacillota bacterium]|nr:exodeoxyribonuclease VII large subunit [Bacillota bacterium]
MSDILSVGELNHYVSELLTDDALLSMVAVKGEISGYKKYPSGHAYFSLKDTTAQVSCVLFRGNGNRLSFIPENGMRVILYGKASLYENDGRFQIVVSQMTEDGIGDLFIQFEKLKTRLSQAGYFDEERKKMLPFLPKRIGVVTSPKGAVIQDIINVISRRYPNFDLLLYPSAVQGKDAANELASGVRYLDERDDIDVIIIARGGGSMEDLWCFNDEALARSIFQAETPIISAVGHETDFTICDFCADLRAPTPSAAAELVYPMKEELESKIDTLTQKLSFSVHHYFRAMNHQYELLSTHRALMKPQIHIEKESQRLDIMQERLIDAQNRLLSLQNHLFAMHMEKLSALSPLRVLTRGYSFVKDENNCTIDSIHKVNLNDTVHIYVSDGKIDACVTNCKERNNGL